jgi:hypothetical protein
MNRIRDHAIRKGIPFGVHVVTPSTEEMQNRFEEGHRFLAFSTDAYMLSTTASSRFR